MDNIPVRFRFVGIQIVSKNVAEIFQPLPIAALFNFNIKVEMKVQAEAKLVMPFVNVIITEFGNSIELANITVACLFQVDNFEETIKSNEQNIYTVPPDFEATIRPVSISTTRGIVYSELRGTHLNNAIMPVVFMDAFTEVQKKEQPQQEIAVRQ